MVLCARGLSKTGASPCALRHREWAVRSSVDLRLLAQARVFLWLLLTGEFCQKQCVLWSVLLVVDCFVYRFFAEVWTDHVEASWCCRDDFWCFMCVCWREFRIKCAVLVFFCASAWLVLRFNAWEGSTFIYHLVAASIHEDRLRAEECHPRKILGSYDTRVSRGKMFISFFIYLFTYLFLH